MPMLIRHAAPPCTSVCALTLRPLSLILSRCAPCPFPAHSVLYLCARGKVLCARCRVRPACLLPFV